MHKISQTSALVLKALQPGIYTTQAAIDYLAGLDLSAGDRLTDRLAAHNALISYNITHRKFALLHALSDLSAQARLPRQVLVGAAGLDAMGLEIATRYPACTVFEIDRDQMQLKRRMIDRKNIFFITADLADPHRLRDRLARTGWQAEQPSLLLLEGISYYIGPHVLRLLVKDLAPDYVMACFFKKTGITAQGRKIGDFIFDTIREECDTGPTQYFDAPDLAALLEMKLLDHWPMERAEAVRLGRETYLSDPAENYLDLVVLSR